MDRKYYYRDRLLQEFVQRRDKNGRYSLRGFARNLGIDPGSLSKTMAGTMIPSWELSERIAGGLKLTAQEQRLFLGSIAELQRARAQRRLNPNARDFEHSYDEPETDLSPEAFAIISDWYHFAILDLPSVKGFSSSPDWIAQELGISVAEAAVAIDRLLQLGFLQRSENGVLLKTSKRLTISCRESTAPSQLKHQQQVLQLALKSLDELPMTVRNMSSLCMAIDPTKIPEARKMIQDFKRKLCSLLETGERTHVYELSVALFPIQKIDEQNDY